LIFAKLKEEGDILMDDNFVEIPFPANGDIVYIIGIKRGNRFHPFYIGQSSRNIGRFGDYLKANFSAPTDFKVGEAIKYFFKKRCEVVIKYRESQNRTEDENALIKKYKESGASLLNVLQGYDYRRDDESKEREKVQEFVDNFLKTMDGPCEVSEVHS